MNEVIHIHEAIGKNGYVYQFTQRAALWVRYAQREDIETTRWTECFPINFYANEPEKAGANAIYWIAGFPTAGASVRALVVRMVKNYFAK